jgi:hypothetical protein
MDAKPGDPGVLAHIESICTRTEPDTDRLVVAMLRYGWPGGTGDRTEPVAPTPPQCQVVSLKGTPLAVAKAVLVALHCTVGKVSRATSKTVAKGLVIGTTPTAGTRNPWAIG